MKKTLLGALLIGSLFTNQSFAQTWTTTSSMGGMNPSPKDIELLSPTEFYYGGSFGIAPDPRGFVYKVDNFAASNVNTGFSTLYVSPTSGPNGTTGVNSMDFTSTTKGWAVWNNLITNTGYVVNTIDGGVNWLNQFSLTGVIKKIQFLDDLNGFFLEENAVYSTSNGGATWTTTNSPGAYLFSMFFTSTTVGYVVDISGTLYKTIDGGNSWSNQILPGFTSGFVSPIKFFDANIGWIVGGSGKIYKTTDAGNSWVAQTSGTTETLTDLSILNANEIFVCGFNGVMCSTTNGGTTWVASTIPNSGDFIAMDFYQNFGRAITRFGKMFKYCPAPITNNISLTLCDGSNYNGVNINGSGPYVFAVNNIGGCQDSIFYADVTVYDVATIAPLVTQTTCVGLPMTDYVIATTNLTGVSISGAPAGITATYANNQITISGTPSASGSFNVTVTGIGQCSNVVTGFFFDITPLPTMDPAQDQTVCVNGNLTQITLGGLNTTGAIVTGLPPGLTYTPSNFGFFYAIIHGSPTASGVYTYTVTPTSDCGSGATSTGTITVTSGSTITAGTNQSVCSNTAISSINLTTSGTTGATATGLPAGVTGVWANDVFTISGTPTVNGSFTYSVTTSGGCAATTTGIINVADVNTIAQGSNQTVGINNVMTPINIATTGATGATVTGLPSGVTSNWANNTVTISGTPNSIGTFNYTVTTTGGCGSAVTTTGTIVVENSVGVTENSTLNFIIFPNPSSSITTLSGLTNGQILKVVDITGKVVYQTIVNNAVIELDVTTFSNGVYVIQVEQNGAIAQKKLVVNK